MRESEKYLKGFQVPLKQVVQSEMIHWLMRLKADRADPFRIIWGRGTFREEWWLIPLAKHIHAHTYYSYVLQNTHTYEMHIHPHVDNFDITYIYMNTFLSQIYFILVCVVSGHPENAIWFMLMFKHMKRKK